MSEQTSVPPTDEAERVEGAARETTSSGGGRGMPSFVSRNLGLVAALGALVVIGWVTKGDTFMTGDNLTTVMLAAAPIGVVAVGMTFVITGGGIDLSVGAIVALSSVWATTVATQNFAADTHWIIVVTTALAVGGACGLVNGVVIAYGKVVAFMTTLAMLAAARGLAETMSDRRTQRLLATDNQGFYDFFRHEVVGVSMLIIIFLVTVLLGWLLLNRTTFGRRTLAIGGNPEAARLAGINVSRHTVWLYVLVGLCSGLAGTMLIARTTAGTSTHGLLYELDAIAAVVIGGTLLSGGRGTVTGTFFGVLIFATLQNLFTQNNLTTSSQAIAKGAIIVIAVLLQQYLAKTGTRFTSPPTRNGPAQGVTP
jgi:ribose transport system permease protein